MLVALGWGAPIALTGLYRRRWLALLGGSVFAASEAACLVSIYTSTSSTAAFGFVTVPIAVAVAAAAGLGIDGILDRRARLSQKGATKAGHQHARAGSDRHPR